MKTQITLDESQQKQVRKFKEAEMHWKHCQQFVIDSEKKGDDLHQPVMALKHSKNEYVTQAILLALLISGEFDNGH